MSESIKTIEEYIRKINGSMEKIRERFSYEDLIFVYRGESKDYGLTKMMPTLLRDNDYDEINSMENRVLESISDNGISESQNTMLDKMIDTQHYIAYSRLLDVSFNALVALFFSIENESKDSDSYVHIIGMPKQFVFSPSSKYLNDYYEKILEGDEQIIDENVKLILSSQKNERIIAQDGGFLLFPGKNFIPIPEIYFETITIDKEKKKDFLNNLNLLFNINKSKIYPEKNYRKGKIDDDVKNRLMHGDYSVDKEINLLANRYLLELKCYENQLNTDDEDYEIKLGRFKRAYRNNFRYLVTNIYQSHSEKIEKAIHDYEIREKFI